LEVAAVFEIGSWDSPVCRGYAEYTRIYNANHFSASEEALQVFTSLCGRTIGLHMERFASDVIWPNVGLVKVVVFGARN
jgi:hypothetical protein